MGQEQTPQPGDFGQPLPALAARILRDLPGDERDLLRAAALVGTFDENLLRAAYPGVRDSVLLRFTSRTFLDTDATWHWPYSLHQLLRDAIRNGDTGLHDSWSPRERDQVAVRIGGYLDTLAASAAAAGDRSTQIAAVLKAIQLCLDTRQLFGWLIEAVQRLIVSGGWTALTDLPTGQDNGPLTAVLLGLRGARERRSGSLDAAVEMMDTALAVPDLPAGLRRFLVLHRAHALRVAGRYAEGADGYRELLREPGDSFSPDARYWLADYAFLQGRFGEALDSLRALPDEQPDLHGEVLRLQGHVYRVNALFDQAELNYRAALELARQTSNTAAEGKALTDLMQTLAWHRPAGALAVRDQAIEVNESLSNLVEIVKIRAASAVALANSGDLTGAEAEIERGLTLTRECSYPGGQVWCWVARVLHRLKAADPHGAAEAAGQVEAITAQLHGNRFWSQTAAWWTAAPRTVTGLDWIGGADAAQARWLAVHPGDPARKGA